MSTRWFPDTCDCVIVYDADGEKLHVVVVEHACELHTGARDGARQWPRGRAQMHLEVVLAHNRARPDKLEG